MRTVININAEENAAMHYGKTIALVGDAAATLKKLIQTLRVREQKPPDGPSDWYKDCQEQRQDWEAFKQARYSQPTLFDEVWGREVLTQPAVLKVALDWAR